MAKESYGRIDNNMDIKKFEVLSKPILSQTRSVDEGFESDSADISSSSSISSRSSSEAKITSSSSIISNNKTTVNIVQRTTDRDGMQHTQIARRYINDLSVGSARLSAQGQIELEVNSSITSAQAVELGPNKVAIPRAAGGSSSQKQQYNIQSQQQLLQQELCRVIKVKTPPSVMRSLSVDAMPQRDIIVPSNTMMRNNNTMVNGGKYARASSGAAPIKPKQAIHLQGVSSNGINHHQQHKQIQILPSSSLYTFYPAEGSLNLYPTHYGLTYKSSHMNIQTKAPVSWTQSVPRQTRR